MFSVELVPDAAIEAAVRDDWARLERAELPNSGRNPSPSNRPHITLAVRDELVAGVVRGAEERLPLPLELSGILLFPRRRGVVVARHVVVSGALLALHREIADRLGAPPPRYANTSVGRWTPHVTLARSVPSADVASVLATIEAGHVVGEAVGLRVWDAAARTITTLR
ncbi:2'-5' RNA ligase family protein [Microbacterium gallinarum]|uniref:2'-5' RNA ligase family protein n=1 Tax=Microbacterium gallinarum TaxID=2762209 RepID=A0ABR8WZ35_9MICO|nr:2'-5' RNA ligase family protein [Microbacterium gallinarum]MBD8022328.1 2'-5' RNA ligase family protein [Microbacterium gallinarum]